jgi:hypothetical protein
MRTFAFEGLMSGCKKLYFMYAYKESKNIIIAIGIE